ncbi:MAG: hypothetical protein IPK91_02625 [Saprospiraceae bacterium]|nr:hypothetical protein [Saprospiraceae bacterium]MBK8296184.1 hypothetical protein [Saprospiraceae bacterium]
MGKDAFTKKWIIDNSVDICQEYEYGVLTLRALHYQLVGLGMTNDIQHYKRVVAAMIDARWDNTISFDQFSDLDRQMIGETAHEETNLESEIDLGKRQIIAWMNNYKKNRWENQPVYPEVLIEKKALQGVFAPICQEWNISLGACKGYPSLTFLNEMYKRMSSIDDDKEIIILYFGDYDPSGEDIPRSIVENLSRFGIEVDLRRIALMKSQVIKWKLPPAPAKSTDSRTANWDGLGQVELDAVRPEMLRELIEDSIKSIFNHDLFSYLMESEKVEKNIYQDELKQYVLGLK